MVLPQRVSLSIGPVLFNWPAQRWSDFYARLADEAPVDSIYVGEVVCSKRLPYYLDAISGAVDRLQRAGKTVVLSTLALVTLPRERRDCADMVRTDGCEIEVNDISALAYLTGGQNFRVGPYINVYNESTLRYLADFGATSVCLPPELPLASVAAIAAEARNLHLDCEIWAFGRIPLAISGRCYHARVDGLTKDSCQFGCSRDHDGLGVQTLDGKDILALNGVQTMSHSYCNLIDDVDRVADTGITTLRLSPHTCDMVAIAQTFRDRLDGKIGAEEATACVSEICGDVPFSNGYLFGRSGVEMIRRSP